MLATNDIVFSYQRSAFADAPPGANPLGQITLTEATASESAELTMAQ